MAKHEIGINVRAPHSGARFSNLVASWHTSPRGGIVECVDTSVYVDVDAYAIRLPRGVSLQKRTSGNCTIMT